MNWFLILNDCSPVFTIVVVVFSLVSLIGLVIKRHEAPINMYLLVAFVSLIYTQKSKINCIHSILLTDSVWVIVIGVSAYLLWSSCCDQGIYHHHNSVHSTHCIRNAVQVWLQHLGCRVSHLNFGSLVFIEYENNTLLFIM